MAKAQVNNLGDISDASGFLAHEGTGPGALSRSVLVAVTTTLSPGEGPGASTPYCGGMVHGGLISLLSWFNSRPRYQWLMAG